jgi:1-acyl-sn-glycerol-3-phosphate acyltransferase
VLRTDHWDIAYPHRNPGGHAPHTSTHAFQPFPRAAAMAALIRTLAEVGLLAPSAGGLRALTGPAQRAPVPVPSPPPAPNTGSAGAAEAAPAVASAPMTRTDRVIADSARILAAWLYRSIDVHRVEPQPDGPLLALVNHGGGFEDPVLTIAASRRMPRFVARDVIWRVPGAAWVMRTVRAIPIHRRADSPTVGVDNSASFEAVTEALADGQLVAIFPEGESIDTPGVHQLRTGAARMALAAHTAGVRGLRIQPIGLHYLDKGGLRSRAFVKVGPALQLDDLLAELGGVPADTTSEHALVRALTARFTDALRAVSPEFRDWSQARDLQAAAAIALRSAEDSRPTAGVLASYGNAARLADLLEDAPEDHVAAVTRAVRDYEDDLEALGLTDADVAGHTALRGHLARRALQLAVAVPAAAATLPANGPGFVVASLVGRLPIAPPTMATVKPMTAMVAFPAGWTWYALRGRDRRPGRVLARYLAAQVGLASALVVADRAGSLTRAGRASWAARRYPTGQVSAHRRAVIDAVTHAAEVATHAAGAAG